MAVTCSSICRCFFAYAALYPDEQVLLFMFLPIKMKYLALADAALYLYYFIVGGASTRVTIVLCLLNVFLFRRGHHQHHPPRIALLENAV